MKISVFVNDNRWSIKFEQGLLEQTYKFRDGEGVASLEEAIRWTTEAVIASVTDTFTRMHHTRLDATHTHLPALPDEFETII
jgi:hypothetical protein